MKTVINENKLRAIVAESVKNVLNEKVASSSRENIAAFYNSWSNHGMDDRPLGDVEKFGFPLSWTMLYFKEVEDALATQCPLSKEASERDATGKPLIDNFHSRSLDEFEKERKRMLKLIKMISKDIQMQLGEQPTGQGSWRFGERYDGPKGRYDLRALPSNLLYYTH